MDSDTLEIFWVSRSNQSDTYPSLNGPVGLGTIIGQTNLA